MTENKLEEKAKKKQKNYLVLFAIVVLVGAGVYYFINSRNANSSPSINNGISKAPDNSNSNNSSEELTSKKWTWVESRMVPDITTIPSTENVFTATFNPNGVLDLTTDCNSGNSTYEVGDNNFLTIAPIASTMMFCEGSAETAYFKQIQTAEGYKIENGQLHIILLGDTGTMIFK